MTPEELNAAHRDYVVAQLGRHAAMVHQLMVDDDPETLSRLVVEYGTVLSEHGLIQSSQAVRMNRVFLALYKNTELEEWGWRWSETVSQDGRAAAILERMNTNPTTVQADEFRYIYDTYLSSDAYIRPALEIILADPGFRDAMELEEGITVEEFRRRSLAVAWDVATFEEFQEVAQQYAYFGPFICGGSVCAVALAFAFAFVFVGPTPVTCASGSTVLESLAKMLPVQNEEVLSGCVNASSKTAWVVVKGHSGFRRVPLGPGETSRQLGLAAVEAIIIGGHGNAVASVSTPSTGMQASGCYVIAGDREHPGMVTIVDSPIHGTALRVNDAQHQAEIAGTAGYSSVAPGRVAAFADERFAMDSAAALVPATADRDRLFKVIAASTKHARALRVMQWLESLQPRTALSC